MSPGTLVCGHNVYRGSISALAVRPSPSGVTAGRGSSVGGPSYPTIYVTGGIDGIREWDADHHVLVRIVYRILFYLLVQAA